MTEVGIRALKQNASGVVAEAVAGETITITDRGRPVAQLTALPASPLERLLAAGVARPPILDLASLPDPAIGPALSGDLLAARDGERY